MSTERPQVHAFLLSVLLAATAARLAAQQRVVEVACEPGPCLEERHDLRSPAPRTLSFEGFVHARGVPVEGAVVVSSAGGRAVTEAGGRFWLEATVPPGAESLQITAVGQAGANLLASTSVPLQAAAGNVWVGSLELTGGTTCSPSWLPTFGPEPGMNATVRALAAFDDGGGAALYAAGDFTSVGGVVMSRIARWDGVSWTPVGNGVDGTVNALAVFDDGVGARLYAGGSFTTAGGVAADRIARWDGTTWAPLFGGGTNGSVLALAVLDDGSGAVLCVGGEFTLAGGVAAGRIATWDGSSWAPLGTGMNAAVRALAELDDGSGPALYAGGSFTSAGGVAANRIAMWDGASWSPLGTGMSGAVHGLVGFDDGGGPALYAGGAFTTAGGVAANRIARWDGTSWTALGAGVNSTVQSLAVLDDGGGPVLHAGGSFGDVNGVTPTGIARWDGSSWMPLGSGTIGTVFALAAFDDGGGPTLHAGGDFTAAGGAAASRVAKWDGTSWMPLGPGGLSGAVRALTVFDDGGGPALYAGGDFTSPGSMPASRVAKWDGASWTPLGSGGVNGAVRALAVFDDGGGPALFVGGDFTSAGGVAASRIAKWDGSSWTSLGSGLSGFFFGVYALTVFDDGGGPALYAGGGFLDAGGVAVNGIARWDGSSWAPLGSGVNGFPPFPVVYCLTVFDDGGGPALYAGGSFTTAGDLDVNRIARWDGSSWAALGNGLTGPESPLVNAMAVFDDGGGPALYVGGQFSTAGFVSASRIARWDGSVWAPVGTGLFGTEFPIAVSALAVFQSGGAPALHVGGQFTTAGGMAARAIARWDGSSWAPLGNGVDGVVAALTVFDDGGGPALFAGGAFTSAIDSGDSHLAKWGCIDSLPPVLSCPESVLALDGFRDGPGEIVTFSVTAKDDVDPAPVVVCVPPSGSSFTPGTTIVTCTATDTTGKSSVCQFPVTVQIKALRR